MKPWQCLPFSLSCYVIKMGYQTMIADTWNSINFMRGAVMSLFKDFVQTLKAKSMTEKVTCVFVQALSDLQYQEYFE